MRESEGDRERGNSLKFENRGFLGAVMWAEHTVIFIGLVWPGIHAGEELLPL